MKKEATVIEVLAENAKALRDSRKMSQTAVAKGRSMDQKTVSRIEGGWNITIEILAELASALGVAPWQLLIPGFHKAPDMLPNESELEALKVFRQLKPHEREKWLAMAWIVKDGVPDEKVEKHLPLPPKAVKSKH